MQQKETLPSLSYYRFEINLWHFYQGNNTELAKISLSKEKKTFYERIYFLIIVIKYIYIDTIKHSSIPTIFFLKYSSWLKNKLSQLTSFGFGAYYISIFVFPGVNST